VGVICKVNDRYQVVEYSEISTQTAHLTDAEGELVYSAGNICNHFITTNFLQVLCNNHEHELKHHVAEKKIEYIDDNGVRQKPTKVNGIKLEKFVFDVFPFSTQSWTHGNFAIWEVMRDEEFSPLKNGEDAKKDTPTTCKRDLLAQHHRWLVEAGAKVKPSGDQDTDNQKLPEIEISPLVSCFGEGLEIVKDKQLKEPLVIDRNATTSQVTFNGVDYETYAKNSNL